jgi:hypothetical protein
MRAPASQGDRIGSSLHLGSGPEQVAPLDEVVEHMRSCFGEDYDNPDDAGMVYESAEGGYQGEVWDTHDFVQWQLGLELPNDNHGDCSTLFAAALAISSGAAPISTALVRTKPWTIAGVPSAPS